MLLHGRSLSVHDFTNTQRCPRCSAARASTVRARTVLQRKGNKKQKGGATKEPGFWDRVYLNFTGFPFPLGPLLARKTVRTELDRGMIWLFEQPQSLGFSNVTTNVRMTVVKLQSGGLWVHAPIAPTRECIALVKELGAEVEYIVLPTFAYEHKVFAGPFSRRFPNAKVYTAPRQWSWPLPLPPQALGIFSSGTLVSNDPDAPWAAEIAQKVFSSSVGFGPYSEVAFLHKRSRTLIVTDAVIFVPDQPPEVVGEGDLMEAGGKLPGPVLAFTKGDLQDEEIPPPPSDPAVRRQLGWQRMALQILYFAPYNLVLPEAAFRTIAQKLLVSPVIKTLVFTKASRDEVRQWVDSITDEWDFKRVIPAHFAAPVPATPLAFRAAFSFLYDEAEVLPAAQGGFLAGLLKRTTGGKAGGVEFPKEDMRALDGLEGILKRLKVVNNS